MNPPAPTRLWTVAEAKAKLSEIFRLAEEEGPQHIGTKRRFIVVPERLWQVQERQHMGHWLVENMPRGANLEIPADRKSRREIPFINPERHSRRS